MSAPGGTAPDAKNGRRYRVVHDDQQRYAIWPAEEKSPAGWFGGGRIGTEQECLDYIEQVAEAARASGSATG